MASVGILLFRYYKTGASRFRKGELMNELKRLRMRNEAFGLDLTDPQAIERRGRELVGLTFRDVLSLGIFPPDATEEERSKDYSRKSYKGGVGNLIEERFYGYRANSDSDADFAEAGVELKTTCYDVKRDGDLSAGERLVLSMIPYDRPIAVEYDGSHLRRKAEDIMLVYYERDRLKNNYDQEIKYARLFTPPEEDLAVIREDYRKIAELVRTGRAQNLSESLTSYLGACTKGMTAATSWATQFYPPHDPAKKRAFCFKRQYMDYVLHHYLMGEAEAESVAHGSPDFEETVADIINGHRGQTACELCQLLGIPYTGNKAQWTQISYRLLGARDNRAAEFEKAGVSLRTVRLEEGGGRIKESLSLNTFEFMEIVNQGWDDSDLCDYLSTTRFLFVIFEKHGDNEVLQGCRFWSMPLGDVNGPARECWEHTRDTVRRGVKMTIDDRGRILNDLPGISDGIVHVRPHANRAAYRFADGTEVGDVTRDASELPDGRAMTRQSFWLSAGYVRDVLRSMGI